MSESAADGNVYYTSFVGAKTSSTFVDNRYGGGGGGTMEPTIPLKDYVDARDEAVEARLAQKLDTLSTKGTIWGAAATVIGIILAVLAFGGDRFDGGVGVSGAVREQTEAQQAVDRAQDAKLDAIDRKIDVLVERSAAKRP